MYVIAGIDGLVVCDGEGLDGEAQRWECRWGRRVKGWKDSDGGGVGVGEVGTSAKGGEGEDLEVFATVV